MFILSQIRALHIHIPAPLMQAGAHTVKGNTAEADLHSCLPGPLLPFSLGLYIHPSIFSPFSQKQWTTPFNEASLSPVLQRCSWSAKKSSWVTRLIASSWLVRNLNPQNLLFDLLCGFVEAMRSPNEQKLRFYLYLQSHWALMPMMPYGLTPTWISL